MHVPNRHLRSEILHYQARLRSWEDYCRRRAAMQRPGCRADKPKPQVSNELGSMILTLCTRLAERPNFAGYTFKDDLIGAAVLDCLSAVEKFNCVSSTSAFAYLTTCAWRRMAREISREAAWHAVPNPEPGTPAALYYG